MIQPSGLPGLREATTKPTTPRAAEYQTGDDPGQAQAAGDQRGHRRQGPEAVGRSGAHRGPAVDPTTLMGGTLRTDSSGNVTAEPGTQRYSPALATSGDGGPVR